MYSAAAAPRLRAALRGRIPPDVVCALLIALATLLAAWETLFVRIIRARDPIAFFYPMYSFLGERLRSGDIPGWNPHQFAGAPFAADPQSGWMYLPSMVLFSLLGLDAAARAFVVAHWLLAGLGTYALARALGMGPAGALVAGAAYEFGPLVFQAGIGSPAYAGLAGWLPLVLLCAELGIASRRHLVRCLWWGGAGLALSQVLAVWLGQGSYYALLALGAYVVYRTLIAPPAGAGGLGARVAALAACGCAVLGSGLGFAAAGLLPRLEYNALSSLAGGYRGIGEEARVGGWGPGHWAALLDPHGITFRQGAYTNAAYVGGVVFALAVLAPLVARSRLAVGYSASLCLGALVLSSNARTPLHALLYLLPGFARLHPHYPDRIMVLFYLGAALLAGATASRLGELPGPAKRAVPAALAPVALALALSLSGREFSWGGMLALSAGVALVVAHWSHPGWRRYLTAALVLALLADLWAADQAIVARQHLVATPGRGQGTSLAALYAPTGAVGELLSRAGPAHSRFFGYAARDRRAGTPLGADHATLLGLEDVQGYDPVQVARYDEYMRALNGRPQPWYRRSFVLEGGLRSPLLDLLGARYALATAGSAPSLSRLPGYRGVYAGGGLYLFERRGAFPRAWLVHSALRVPRGGALSLLSSRRVDPRRTALIEGSPPPLAPPRNPSRDRARITAYEPDRVRVRVGTQARGLLVLGDVYYPAWRAYVDGAAVPLLIADHALRAVPVPAGEHDVELRYESGTLRVGIVVSSLTCALLAGVALLGLVARLRAAAPGPVDGAARHEADPPSIAAARRPPLQHAALRPHPRPGRRRGIGSPGRLADTPAGLSPIAQAGRKHAAPSSGRRSRARSG